jgi:hypothetical protein
VIDQAVAVAVTDSMIVVDFEDGRVLQVPLTWFPSIQKATPEQRRNVRRVGGGIGLHWPDLDEDVSIAGLLRRQSQDSAPSSTEAVVEKAHRDHRIAVFETIGCALAALRRLDHVWYDEDVREDITQVRSSLSVAQSKIKERIGG